MRECVGMSNRRRRRKEEEMDIFLDAQEDGRRRKTEGGDVAESRIGKRRPGARQGRHYQSFYQRWTGHSTYKLTNQETEALNFSRIMGLYACLFVWILETNVSSETFNSWMVPRSVRQDISQAIYHNSTDRPSYQSTKHNRASALNPPDASIHIKTSMKRPNTHII